jgi:hypothetical protein
MSGPFLAWCFLLHFVGDFVLQTRWMAENKSKNWLALGAHIGILTVVFALGTLSLPLAALNGIGHAIIDKHSWSFYRWWRADRGPDFAYWKDDLFWITLGADQLAHAVCLIALVEYLF